MEVWDFISNELTEAADHAACYPKGKRKCNQRSRTGVKSKGDAFCRQVPGSCGCRKSSNGSEFIVYTPSYENLFSYGAENNKEVILDIENIPDIHSTNIFQLFAPKSVNGNSKWVPTEAVVDSFQMNNGLAISDPASGFDPYNPYVNRDPRLKYSVFLPGDTLPNSKIFNPYPESNSVDAVGSSFVVSPTGFNIKKYVNKEDLGSPANCGINIILIRYAEILLTYAEAKIELEPD